MEQTFAINHLFHHAHNINYRTNKKSSALHIDENSYNSGDSKQQKCDTAILL